MNKIFVIAKREYLAMVATKTFLVTLIMMPVLMFGGLLLMPAITKMSGGRERPIRIVDGTGRIGSVLEAAAQQHNEAIRKATVEPSTGPSAGRGDPMAAQDFFNVTIVEVKDLDDATRVAWSDEIRNGKLYAFVEIPGDLFQTSTTGSPIRFVSQDAALSSARQWIEAIVDPMVRQDRFNAMGLNAEQVQLANVPVRVSPTSPYEQLAAGDSGEGGVKAKEKAFDLTSLFAPFGMMMLMFLVIFLAAQPMLESAMEEKSQRIAEVLLGAVSPTQLMAGKLLGNVAASLLVFTIYGVGAYLILVQRNMQNLVPLSLLPWFFIFQILGVLFFSSIFMTIGASVRELKEAQSLLLPVWLVMMLPMMVWFVALRDPLGPIAVGLALFPPSAPMMNILRMGTGTTIPIWQPISAAILLALATVAVIWIAGRIYRTSLLRNDSVKSITQLFARIKASTRGNA